MPKILHYFPPEQCSLSGWAQPLFKVTGCSTLQEPCSLPGQTQTLPPMDVSPGCHSKRGLLGFYPFVGDHWEENLLFELGQPEIWLSRPFIFKGILQKYNHGRSWDSTRGVFFAHFSFKPKLILNRNQPKLLKKEGKKEKHVINIVLAQVSHCL